MSGDKTPEQAFAEALAAFQLDLPTVTKDATGQVGNQKTRYADLASIVEAAYPKLAEHGLSYIAAPTMDDGAFVLRYALLHEAGHREGGAYPLPASATSQQIGSALTYARRYCLLAVTGLAPKDDDDDGTKGSEVQTTVLPRAPRRRGATERHNGPDDPTHAVDEWTTPLTDHDWLEAARHRLLAAQNVAEVEAVIADAKRKLSEKRLTPEDAVAFKGETDQRLAEIKGPTAVSA